MRRHISDYQLLSVHEQAALLGKHRASLGSPFHIAQQVRTGAAILLVEPHAMALLYADTDSAGPATRAYIAFLFVRPGRRRRGIGGQMLAAIRARLPGAPLRLQVYGPRAVAFFERGGFIRPPAAPRGYYAMYSDPAEAQAYVDVLPAAVRRALGIGDAGPATVPRSQRLDKRTSITSFPLQRIPMSRLRHLSVWIDEPEPGHFYWVIHEMTEDASVWLDIASGPEPCDLWLDALKAGTVALMRLVDDERIGPRAPGEDEEAAPVG